MRKIKNFFKAVYNSGTTIETREKSRKTNTEVLETEGRQQEGAGATHALAQKQDANRQQTHPDNMQINLDESWRRFKTFTKRIIVSWMKLKSN